MEYYIKHLSGDIICLPTGEQLSDIEVLEKLNILEPIRFPKYRTYLEPSNREKMYNVVINPYLYLSIILRHGYNSTQQLYVTNFRIGMNSINDKELIKNIDECGCDGYTYDEHRSKTIIDMKFLMPVQSLYRLYLVPITFTKFTILHYEDYAELNQWTNDIDHFKKRFTCDDGIIHIFVLDCNGNLVDVSVF
jgi:hypothetical protein